MIEKLKEHDIVDPKTDKVIGKIGCDLREIMDKLNEMVDAVNELLVVKKIIFRPIDALNDTIENTTNSKMESVQDKSDIKTELERTRKALEIAKDTIIHADWFFDGDYNVDAKTMHNEIKCAIKAITALEQKG